LDSQDLYCIAHRGGCGHGSENALQTIENSIQLGTDAIEIDVWRVEDQLLVIHDRRLGRLLPGKGLISQQRFESLRQSKLPCGAMLPTLREVFQLVANRCTINIELKGQQAIDTVIAEINEAKLCGEVNDEQLLISSFDHHQLYRAMEVMPAIRRGVLMSAIPLSYTKVGEPLKAYAIHPDIDCINQALVDDAHRRGFKVFCYTVNEPEDLEQMAEMHVDGVFCDFPDRILNLRRQLYHQPWP
jgi:glycerophosphoryl diester phosphodiesterase